MDAARHPWSPVWFRSELQIKRFDQDTPNLTLHGILCTEKAYVYIMWL